MKVSGTLLAKDHLDADLALLDTLLRSMIEFHHGFSALHCSNPGISDPPKHPKKPWQSLGRIHIPWSQQLNHFVSLLFRKEFLDPHWVTDIFVCDTLLLGLRVCVVEEEALRQFPAPSTAVSLRSLILEPMRISVRCSHNLSSFVIALSACPSVSDPDTSNSYLHHF